MELNRRKFIRGTAAAGALTFLPSVQAKADVSATSYATLIDLTKCNGCTGHDVPLCVTACRKGRESSFPQPQEDQLLDYWPQKHHEDWSQKRHITGRLTPYNWIFVQHIEVNGRTLHIPRRCMHCDNPPCAKLCPFGVNHKTKQGPVYIDASLCFGGGKCRTVCPWRIPQRQAGVGIYTLWQKVLPVGGGVMYKCDLCRDRLGQGKTPHCIEACPQQAMHIGTRQKMINKAQELQRKYNGDIYGLTENGGTSTLYVSPIAFSELDKQLARQKQTKGMVRLHNSANMLDKQYISSLLSLLSPVLGIVAALGLTLKKNSRKERD